MSGTCSRQYVVEADGEVYPCDFYVLDQYKLGSLVTKSFKEIDQVRSEIEFLEESRNVHSDCRECKYGAICRGGCKRYRNPKDYLCKAYYEFFDIP
ncbi:MAG: SPASM domain-containing protein [Anaerocolumna sp.]